MDNNQSEPIIDERAERVEKRAVKPKEDILNHLLTYNFTESINNHKLFVQKMLENPVETYLLFRERLDSDGCETSFPEFEGVIGYLIKSLFQNSEIYTWFQNDSRNILIEQLLNKIIGLTIEGRFYYPYSSTIYVIEDILELLDYYYRSNIKNTEGLPVNEQMGPYYHIFRYRSYITTFLCSREFGIPNNIIFPTHFNISATSLIKLRCVPILIMGVINKPIYVDQYLNSPLDFWAHDIQHSKRQIQETLRYYDVFIKHNNYYKRRTLYDIKTPIQFYKYMHDFTVNKIIPMIKINRDDSDEIKAYKSIKRLIIFEVVHEKAWPITQPSLCRNISLRYDEFPVENIYLNNDKIDTFHYLFSDPSTIGNVIAKLRHGFYDKSNDVDNKILEEKYRTARNVAKCAREIMVELECTKIPSEDYFLALATDKHALQEFTDLPEISTPDDPASIVPYPEGNPNNIYSDSDLMTKFIPSANPESVIEQETLHRKTQVDSYDPNIFENKAGGKKKQNIKSKKHIISKNKKTKRIKYNIKRSK
jgi:hypothetical protein